MSHLERHTEHGQDWISCLLCGAAWSVVTCEDQHGNPYEDTERVSIGDGHCESHDLESELHRLDENGEWS